MLKDRALQQFGTPDEIYNNPENMFVAECMGSPSMNLVTAEVVEQDGLQLQLSGLGYPPVSLAFNMTKAVFFDPNSQQRIR